MTSTRWSTLSSCHLQTCNLGMAMGAEVVGAPGLLYVYYGSSPLKDGVVIVYGLNWHLWECPFGVNHTVGQIWTVVGSMDSNVDTQAPCLYPAFTYSPGNLLLTLNSSGVCGKVGWFTNPHAHPCKQEYSIPRLIWTEALSQRTSPIKKDWPTWAGYHSFSESCSSITEHIFH